ncbi:MAG: hypothetical protein SGPRY_003672 [Prymnesium sp.]
MFESRLWLMEDSALASAEHASLARPLLRYVRSSRALSLSLDARLSQHFAEAREGEARAASRVWSQLHAEIRTMGAWRASQCERAAVLSACEHTLRALRAACEGSSERVRTKRGEAEEQSARATARLSAL